MTVTDVEDTVDYQNLIVQPALGHDDHAHPLLEYRGKTGSVITDLGTGHSEDMKVFFALDARYTDKGDGDVPALTGTDTVILQPKRKEAEHADGLLGPTTAEATGDAEGTSALTGLGDGDWASYEPVNFTGIDTVTFRVASTTAGGSIELRKDSPTGTLLGTATVPATGSMNRWADVTIPAPTDKTSMGLFLVFKGTSNFRLNFFEVNGKGLSPDTRPTVKITAPAENAAVHAGSGRVQADATDAENAITKVEFFVDGAKVGEDTRRPVQRQLDADDGEVLHRASGGHERQGPRRRFAQGALLGRRVRHPAAVGDVRERRRGRSTRSATSSPSAPRAPTCGRRRTSSARSTCRAASARTSSRPSRSPRSTAPTPPPRRESSSATRSRRAVAATTRATSSSVRRATAKPSTCTTPAATAK